MSYEHACCAIEQPLHASRRVSRMVANLPLLIALNPAIGLLFLCLSHSRPPLRPDNLPRPAPDLRGRRCCPISSPAANTCASDWACDFARGFTGSDWHWNRRKRGVCRAFRQRGRRHSRTTERRRRACGEHHDFLFTDSSRVRVIM